MNRDDVIILNSTLTLDRLAVASLTRAMTLRRARPTPSMDKFLNRFIQKQKRKWSQAPHGRHWSTDVTAIINGQQSRLLRLLGNRGIDTHSKQTTWQCCKSPRVKSTACRFLRCNDSEQVYKDVLCIQATWQKGELLFHRRRKKEIGWVAQFQGSFKWTSPSKLPFKWIQLKSSLMLNNWRRNIIDDLIRLAAAECRLV